MVCQGGVRLSLTDWGRGLTMKENRLGPMGRNIPAEVGGMSVEYQVQRVYRQEDVAALVKVLEVRRRPEKICVWRARSATLFLGCCFWGGGQHHCGHCHHRPLPPLPLSPWCSLALCILGALPFCAGRTAGEWPDGPGPGTPTRG